MMADVSDSNSDESADEGTKSKRLGADIPTPEKNPIAREKNIGELAGKNCSIHVGKMTRS